MATILPQNLKIQISVSCSMFYLLVVMFIGFFFLFFEFFIFLIYFVFFCFLLLFSLLITIFFTL